MTRISYLDLRILQSVILCTLVSWCINYYLIQMKTSLMRLRDSLIHGFQSSVLGQFCEESLDADRFERESPKLMSWMLFPHSVYCREACDWQYLLDTSLLFSFTAIFFPLHVTFSVFPVSIFLP